MFQRWIYEYAYKNIFKYSIEINKEDARFRILVSKAGKFKKSNVNRLVGKAEIKKFFEELPIFSISILINIGQEFFELITFTDYFLPYNL